MRVNLLTTQVAKRLQSGNDSKATYFTPILPKKEIDNFSAPSFTGLGSVVKRLFGGVAKLPESAPRIGELVKAESPVTAVVDKAAAELLANEAKLKKAANRFMDALDRRLDISKYKDNDFFSNVTMNMPRLKKALTNDNIDFLSTYLVRQPDFNIRDNWKKGQYIDSLALLAERYNKFPNARPIMQKMVEEFVDGKPRFSLDDLSSTGIFGYNFNGSDAQIAFISKMVAAKNVDGKPRFVHFAIMENLSNVTEQNLPAVDYLLSLKTTYTENIDPERLAQIIRETEPDKIAEKLKSEEKVKDCYLVEDFAQGLDDVLEQCTPEKMPVLKRLIEEGFDFEETARILKHWTPENNPLFEKALNAVDADGDRVLTGHGIANVLEYSKPAAKATVSEV